MSTVAPKLVFNELIGLSGPKRWGAGYYHYSFVIVKERHGLLRGKRGYSVSYKNLMMQHLPCVFMHDQKELLPTFEEAAALCERFCETMAAALDAMKADPNIEAKISEIVSNLSTAAKVNA